MVGVLQLKPKPGACMDAPARLQPGMNTVHALPSMHGTAQHAQHCSAHPSTTLLSTLVQCRSRAASPRTRLAATAFYQSLAARACCSSCFSNPLDAGAKSSGKPLTKTEPIESFFRWFTEVPEVRSPLKTIRLGLAEGTSICSMIVGQCDCANAG